MNVGGAQTELATAAFEVDTTGILTHFSAHGFGGASGRTVVDYKEVEPVRQRHYGVDHLLDILDFIIGRYDNKHITHKYLSLGHIGEERINRAIFVANLAKKYRKAYAY